MGVFLSSGDSLGLADFSVSYERNSIMVPPKTELAKRMLQDLQLAGQDVGIRAHLVISECFPQLADVALQTIVSRFNTQDRMAHPAPAPVT